MTISLPKTILATLVACVLAAGCQSNPSKNDDPVVSGDKPEPTTSTRTSGSSDATRTRREGAAMGALVGSLLGYALGGDNRTTSTLVGAAAGAGVGYLVGNEIAERKQKYATEEDFLDSEITSAREYNDTATAYNDQLREEIVQLEKRTGLLESRYRAGMASRDEVKAEKASLKEQIASADKVYDDLKKEYDIKVAVAEERKQAKGGDDVYVQQLEDEISSLKENMDQLQAQSVQLAQIDERLTI